MRLSLKQKQVIGVTFMVALIVIALSLLHLSNTADVLLEESKDRFELFGSSVYSQAAVAIASPETAYNDVRVSKYVQSALQSALYSADTIDALIVDPTGVVIASSDPDQVGKTVPRRPQLNELDRAQPGRETARHLLEREQPRVDAADGARRDAVRRDSHRPDDGARAAGPERFARSLGACRRHRPSSLPC